jgi:hypothetical protein
MFLMGLALRVEWAKCKARASRWNEEILLVEEEMRRVIAFGRWKADWWKAQITRRHGIENGLYEGLRAYAVEHEALEREFADALEAKWCNIRCHAQSVLADLAKGIAPDYTPTTEIDVEIELDTDDYSV